MTPDSFPASSPKEDTLTTTITPLEAAEAAGISVFEFDNILRDQAAMRLENLASRIRRGNESAAGDVERSDYDDITASVWRQVEAAKVLTAHWLNEPDDAE